MCKTIHYLMSDHGRSVSTEPLLLKFFFHFAYSTYHKTSYELKYFAASKINEDRIFTTYLYLKKLP